MISPPDGSKFSVVAGLILNVNVSATDPEKGRIGSLSCSSDVGVWSSGSSPGTGTWSWSTTTRDVGTSHSVACTATDGFGNAAKITFTANATAQ